MMSLHDLAFQHTFSKLFVYNILFEDAEVDERYLNVDHTSRVLSITGAGCGVAGFLSRHPVSIDAVDINPHHLALAALKVAAARYLLNYTDFYDLLGYGAVSDPQQTLLRLSPGLPRWAQRYWRRHMGRFRRNFYEQGLTAVSMKLLRDRVGLDAEFMRLLVSQDGATRLETIEAKIEPIFRTRPIKWLINSPLQLLSLGVNFEQRERMLHAEAQEDVVGFIVNHLRRIALTDLETNWFAWLHVAGHYNHAREDALPPYLRPDRWESARRAPTHSRYHNQNIFKVLSVAERASWTHYTLCDMPDWLPHDAQRLLLYEIARTSRPGAVMLYRTVEDDCIVERHKMGDRFKRLDAISELATEQDRSRQYRHVHFYEVH